MWRINLIGRALGDATDGGRSNNGSQVIKEFTWVRLKFRLSATWCGNRPCGRLLLMFVPELRIELRGCDEFIWVWLKLRLSATWRGSRLGLGRLSEDE
uniref:Uncharacterized protein n=1 Tax=Tanacetum cinerariifolium TaxID=118510 RepID=A0A6L2JGF5_TANCI|nr:hypothetical protein [Tanacetum cinerariifolium]